MPFLKTLLLALSAPLFLLGSWYDQKLEGWYYFEEQKSAEEKPPITPEEADAHLLLESHKLKQLLSLALLVPTPENVKNYIQKQCKWIQQSNKFAEIWGKTLLDHPELGDFLATPTSNYGILAKRAFHLQQRKDLLKTLSQNYFLLLFFKGKDPFAEKMADVVQLFASVNGWKYKAVSLDGIMIPQIETCEMDKGISHYFNISATPSLYIVDPVKKQFYPVGAGLISVSEIEANIQSHFFGEEHE